MAFQNSVTYQELVTLANSGLKPTFWNIDCSLLINDKEYPVINVLSLQIQRDYLNNYSDVSIISIQVDPVVYQELILPNKHHLSITIFRSLQGPYSQATNVRSKEYWVYDAHIVDAANPSLLSQSKTIDDVNKRQSASIVTLDFQLTERVLTDIRVKEVGGVYNDVTVGEVITSELMESLNGTQSQTTLSSEQYTGVRGVGLVDIGNNRRYQHIVVPTGTRLYQLPDFLQKTYGVYSTGIGYYLQNGQWYVYPLLDFTRFKQVNRTLTVLNIPKDDMVAPERSYLLRASQLYVFATGDTVYVDRSDSVQMNQGNALTFFDSNTMVDGVLTKTNNRAIPEVSGGQKVVGVESRQSGIQNVSMASARYTANPYHEMSNLTAGTGAQVTVFWENANPSLLTPGMAIRFLYVKDREVKSVYGVLLKVNSVMAPSSNQILDNDYRTSCELTLHIQRPV